MRAKSFSYISSKRPSTAQKINSSMNVSLMDGIQFVPKSPLCKRLMRKLSHSTSTLTSLSKVFFSNTLIEGY